MLLACAHSRLPPRDSVSGATRPELPAACEYVTPEVMEFATAASKASLCEAPTLRLATAGLTAFAVTQSTPEMIVETGAVPSQPRTFTATSAAPGATPNPVP